MADTSQAQDSDSTLTLTVLVNGLLMVGLFIWLAHTRNVDGDEGLYLEAARLVGQGKKLYLDFFFQQMPLTPYFYAGWSKLFGFSLLSARVFSALLTAGGGIFALGYVAKTTRSAFIVSFCALLMYANGIFLAWAPVIKTHPFNVFSLTGSCVLLLLWKRRPPRAWLYLALSGFLIGVGVNCRLTLAPFPVFYLFYILSNSDRAWWKNAALFSAGALLSSILTLVYLGWDPHLFLKYNLLFHTKIFPGIAPREFRISIAKTILLAPQILILLVASYLSLLLKSRKGWRFLTDDSFFLCLLISLYFAIHLAAATPFTQYFSTIIPLLVMAALPLIELSLRWASSFRILALAPFIIVYAGFAPAFLEQEIYSVGSMEPVWRVRNIEAAVRTIRRIAKPGEPCLTWWPGYAALSGCRSVPGLENHMREHAILRGIPWMRLKEFKLMPSEELVAALADRKYRVVIDGAYRLDTPFNEYAEYLLQENYRLRAKRGLVKIYTLKGPADELGEDLQKDLKSVESPDQEPGQEPKAGRSRRRGRR